MESMLERLRRLPFFEALDEAALSDIALVGQWQSLAGGWELFAEGDPSDALHFNLSGRLIVVRGVDNGDEVVGYIRAGEPVGEMALLANEPHSASVFALRDTEILTIDRQNAELLMNKHGAFAATVARSILRRTRRQSASVHDAAPRVFALIGTSPSIDIEAFARDITNRIEKLGLQSEWLPIQSEPPDSLEFDRRELTCDVLILAARVDDSAWYRFVIRHADRFLVVARRDAKPPRPFPLTTATGARARKFRLVDLVMLHEGVPACPIVEWMDAVSASRVINCRGGPCRDRLARIIGGRSIGLVLSGGGARAYAHIGAVLAMREVGLPVDFVCGASMGAVIAACVAMGWPNEEIETRIRKAFVETNPLGDHVLPVVALTKGCRVETRLDEHFGEALIEDLAVPFFCVSSNLVDGALRVHRRGKLGEALRASISLPGILPPVVDGDAVLVDGAVVNNFPTDIMSTVHRGLNIGVDVARAGTIDPAMFLNPPGFFGWVSENGFSAAPPIVSLLMRTATARHERTLNVHPPDIMIAPTVRGVELRSWGRFDEAVADGYATTKMALDANAALLRL